MISDLSPSSDNKAKISCRSDGSAAHPVPQMQHPVAPNHEVGILEQVLAVDRAEVPFSSTKYDRHDVHRHLIHEAQAKSLSADVTGRDRNDAFTGKLVLSRSPLPRRRGCSTTPPDATRRA